MAPRRDGSLHLFTAFGIDVCVHWSWFIAAAIFYQVRDLFGDGNLFVYSYLAMFGIVLLHEFGHALACRSVGGKADLIILWPLGGVAFVQPPQRPGAVLWSIIAGPGVNVLLVPVFFVAGLVAPSVLGAGSPWLPLIATLSYINLTLLVFNMLPIYPLDGGQALWALLWFPLGRAKGLRVSATIGLCVAVFFAVLLLSSGAWLGRWSLLFAISLFAIWQAWDGYKAAEAMAQQEDGSWEKAKRRAREIAQERREN